MIRFKSVNWKNFLSTGNNVTQIDLSRSPSTLVVGQNGAGKSTLLDALSFGLFGKPHRAISKNQLVNTINKKHTIVEVEFEVGSHKFKIVRGINPGKFEIWQNGNMINQSSTARDYQKFLETNILKLNHKSFHQIVVLGSSSFIPFMQLNQGNRRDVIEDLLDIQVFSKMNSILKDKISKNKEEINDANYRLELAKEKITMQRKYIRDITEINDEVIREKGVLIEQNRDEWVFLQQSNTELFRVIEDKESPLTNSLSTFHDKKQSLLGYSGQFKQQMHGVVNDAKFYEDNENCPTCQQTINEDLRQNKLKNAQSKAKELQVAMDKISTENAAVEESIDKINSELTEIRQMHSTISANNMAINRLQKEISALEIDINKLTGSEGDLGQANKDLAEVVSERDTLGELKLRLMEEKSYSDAAGEMLKDTGIKTKVIKQYLPVMNKLVNQYLQVLDFFEIFL